MWIRDPETFTYPETHWIKKNSWENIIFDKLVSPEV